ncbi:hypothetical protein D3C83_181800 [compost metagenome]
MSSSVMSPNMAPATTVTMIIRICPEFAIASCNTGNGAATPHTRCATIPAMSAGKISE